MSEAASSETKTIACTLDAVGSKDRFAWIAELNRDALRSYERRGLVLELRYAPHAIERVRELVRGEQECCSFMTFGLHEEPKEVRLTITAPEGARDAADALFEQFVASAPTGAACGCAPAGNRDSKRKSGVAGKAAGGVALVSAAGAVAACAVCVLPLALPAVLLAGAGGVLAWLGNAHVWMTGVAVVALAAAWLWVWRQSARSRVRPAVSTLTMMGVATFLVASALFWPDIEPEILRVVGG
jgi:hypothetical protein